MSLIEELGRRALLNLDAEQAHRFGIKALKNGLVPGSTKPDPATLSVNITGLTFPNPLGIAAGFDKNAEVPDALLRRGMGFAEVGTITPRAQTGNPRPRIFRLPEHHAVINRLGFNNEGHDAAHRRLVARRDRDGIIGVNIGANKDSNDFIDDYVKGIHRFYDVASYFTANISSPNTPGLRNLQAAEALEKLLMAICDARASATSKHNKTIPIFLKIAPDVSDQEISEIADVVIASDINGLIVSNTTISRDLVAGHPQSAEAGGLSGVPLFDPSTLILAKTRKAVGPDFPIIGVGGITDGAKAIQKIRAGANLLQVYTGFVYRGFNLIDEIKNMLELAVRREGVSSIAELTGLDTDFIIDREIN